jgi:outer membrane protein OmpA-like peptidoglycan-associated protein
MDVKAAMRFIIIRWFIAMMAIVVGLTGCVYGHDNISYRNDTAIKGAVTGATAGAVIGSISGGAGGAATGIIVGTIAGGVFGALLERDQGILKILSGYDIQVIQIGDEVRIILPSDKFFHPHSPRLNVAYYPVLKRLTEFINTFEKIEVKISGYTDNRGSPERNCALSRQQARNLSNYFWDHGMDVRVLMSEGYGETNSVADNRSSWGRQANRRIEITLRQLPVAGED